MEMFRDSKGSSFIFSILLYLKNCLFCHNILDDQTHPPAPIMILLSTDGVLCPFYMLNKNPTAPRDLVKPAKQLMLEEERLPRAPSIKPGI